MYRDRDFDLHTEPPWNEQDLVQDLELETLLKAMTGDDKFLYQICRMVLLAGCAEPDEVLYRQAVLRDCLDHPEVIRSLYQLAVDTIEAERKNFWGLARYPMGVLHHSVEVLLMLVETLRQLRATADAQAETFASEGFRRFFAMLRQELGDDYFATIETHLKTLKFHHGVLISARLGEGNRGTDYVLRTPRAPSGNWLQRTFARKPPAYSFTLSPRDENGTRALSELGDRGVNLVANALAQSTEHILSFLIMMRAELAFYVSCLNLHERLTQKGEPVSFPQPSSAAERTLTCRGLYDVCLTLNLPQRVVGNDLDADGKALFVITGANQGGKSTFLRSIGLAQLMMACGLFVPAESYAANLFQGLHTHYKREEDTGMNSGKLDEELARMSAIVDHIRPDALILFNESFAATNEREGSEIASQVTHALLAHRIKVFSVSHLYEFARVLYEEQRPDALFLRAHRETDGQRSFRLEAAAPLATSHGEDLYEKIFGAHTDRPGASEPEPSLGPPTPEDAVRDA
jgi:DNA mismatch repair ATPase MutS